MPTASSLAIGTIGFTPAVLVLPWVSQYFSWTVGITVKECKTPPHANSHLPRVPRHSSSCCVVFCWCVLLPTAALPHPVRS